MLVATFGLVIFLMNEARKPENWQWFTALGGQQDAPSGVPNEPVPDNRLTPPPPSEEPLDTFISPAPKEDAEEDTSGRFFPGVRPKLFETIRDDTTFRADEAEAWFHLLDILARTDQSTLRKRSTGRVTYAELFFQSKEYRGELVTMRGTVRRAWLFDDPPDNDYGIESYYQVWFTPEDNPSTPMVAYCLELPDGFPTGMEVTADAEITGFFFKRWAYSGADNLWTTPVLLSRTVDWKKRVSPSARKVEVNALFLTVVFAFALFVAVAITGFVYVATRRGNQDEPEGLPDFDLLYEANISSDAGGSPNEPDDDQPSQ